MLVFAQAVDDVSEYRVVIMNVGLWELKFIDLDHFFIRVSMPQNHHLVRKKQPKRMC